MTRRFNDLVGQVFEHEGNLWRVIKAGNPGGYTWKITYQFEPAEYLEEGCSRLDQA